LLEGIAAAWGRSQHTERQAAVSDALCGFQTQSIHCAWSQILCRLFRVGSSRFSRQNTTLFCTEPQADERSTDFHILSAVQVQVLIDHGASPLVLDRKGRTPAVCTHDNANACEHCDVAL
jgi:hypothetical protein